MPFITSPDRARINVSPNQSSCTVYFDGMCPVCIREISTYRRLRGADAIHWVDASRCDATQLSVGLDRAHALQRLHVQGANGALLSGAVLTEQVFSIPGFGKLIVDAVFNRDYAVVQAVTLLTGVGFILMSLLADIGYFIVNPKVRTNTL